MKWISRMFQPASATLHLVVRRVLINSRYARRSLWSPIFAAKGCTRRLCRELETSTAGNCDCDLISSPPEPAAHTKSSFISFSVSLEELRACLRPCHRRRTFVFSRLVLESVWTQCTVSLWVTFTTAPELHAKATAPRRLARDNWRPV